MQVFPFLGAMDLKIAPGSYGKFFIIPTHCPFNLFSRLNNPGTFSLSC